MDLDGIAGVDGGFACMCDDPFFGSGCQFFNECSSDPCLNGGSCMVSVNFVTINQYVCLCPNGQTGTNCEITIDSCMSNPCANGATCTNQGSSFSCQCLTGFTGSTCEVNIDDCSPNPCQNGGSCTDQVNGFSCSCAQLFTGHTCETEIPVCTEDTCLNNGTCVEESFGVISCMCTEGYTGEDCSTNIDDCASGPCSNGGSCIDQLSSFICDCPLSHTGELCQTEIDFCVSSPCVFGTCNGFTGGFTCSCNLGFTGPNCADDINECDPDPCQNGNCTDNINSFTCNCFAGYTGVLCSINTDDCASTPCQNGNCTDEVNGYSCSCEPGFSGLNCENQVNFCIDSPCFNDGTCTEQVGTFSCQCQQGWTGDRCQFADSVGIKLAQCGLHNSTVILSGSVELPPAEATMIPLDVNPGEDLFITGWFWQGDEALGTFFFAELPNGQALSVVINATSTRYMELAFPSANLAVIYIGADATEWHHISLMLTSDYQLVVYVDHSILGNQLLSNDLQSFVTSTLPLSTSSMYIGGGPDDLSSPFIGVLREVASHISPTSGPHMFASLSPAVGETDECILQCIIPDFCTSSAQCLDFASSQEYMCLCPFGYTGLLCSNLHSTYSLTAPTTLELPEQEAPNSISLQFRSDASNGQILAYSSQHEQVQLMIQDGSLTLQLSTQCGSNHTLQVSPVQALDDQQWHSVQATFSSSSVSLQLDGTTSNSTDTSCGFSSTGNYFLGAYQDSPGLVSCVNVSINGEIPDATKTVLERGADFGCKQDTAHFIGVSYLRMANFTSRQSTTISIEISTLDSDGIIYYSRREPQPSIDPNNIDFIAIHMTGGKVAFSFNLGEPNTGVMIISDSQVNDGSWHHVEVSQEGMNGAMVVDGTEMEGMTTGVFSGLDVTGSVFLGGVPSSEESMLFSSDYDTYTGCIRNLKQNGITADFQNYLMAQNVHFGTCNFVNFGLYKTNP